MANPNSTIIDNLQVLYTEAKTSKDVKDQFRAKAYASAIKEIKNCTSQLKSGADARKLHGIGAKIADKIQEIIDTGKLHQVEDLGTDELEKTKLLNLFAQIWGVGQVKALALWDAGARSLKDVKTKYIDLLNEKQQIGLKYYKDLQKRVPRDKVEEIAEIITKQIRKICKREGWKVTFRVCGSYRRKAATCGDMDVLLCEQDDNGILAELVSRLVDSGVLIEELGLGSTKYMGITRTSDGTAFRIDMEVIKPHEWPFALLYFTGSGSFNEHQRLIAKKMGYRLSEHGLLNTKTKRFVKGISSEREIFDFLEMDYLSPWDRK